MTMTATRLILAISLLVLSTLAAYLVFAYALLREPGPPAIAPAKPLPADATVVAITTEAAKLPTGEVTTPARAGAGPGRKRLEIRGRVLDREGRPVAGAVIAEERYFQRVRSSPDGSYALPLELPQHRYPVLHFLRSGYEPRRVKLGPRQLGDEPVFTLDVTLPDAVDTVTLDGLVSNDIGLGLAGARVELTAVYPRNSESFTLTEFSDERGRFSFEGVESDQTYKLSANLTPEYPLFEDAEFYVAASPSPIEIVLPTLQFVDLAGMVLDRDLAPVPNYEIYIDNLSTGIHARKIVSDSSGFFSLEHFPLGEISLSTRGAEFHKIAGIELTAGTYRNLELVVDRGNHYLSGWISDIHGMAIEKAMITLDRKFERNGMRHTSYRSQSTGDGGRFRFENLAGGEYRVTVYAFGYAMQEFTHRFDAQAAELHVRLAAID